MNVRTRRTVQPGHPDRMRPSLSRLLVSALAAGALACDLPPVPPPDFPTGVKAEAIGGKVVRVSWDAAPRADRYEVKLEPIAAGGGVDTKKTKLLTLRFDGLALGARYLVRVQAQSDLGSSLWAETSVTTFAPPPRTVRAEPTAQGIRLRWAHVDGAAAYRVTRADAAGEKVLGSTAEEELFDSSCAPGAVVSYRVESLPGPLTEEAPQEVRATCGRARELCVVSQTQGVLAYDPGSAGEQPPLRRFGTWTGLLQPQAIELDATHGELVVIDRVQGAQGPVRRVVGFSRADGSQVRTLGGAGAPFQGDVLGGVAVDAGTAYLGSGQALTTFAAPYSGVAAARATVTSASTSSGVLPFGQLSLDEGAGLLWALDTSAQSLRAWPLADLRAAKGTVVQAHAREVVLPAGLPGPVRVRLDVANREVVVASQGTEVFLDVATGAERRRLAVDAAAPGAPIGLDAQRDELWTLDGGALVARPRLGSGVVRRIEGPATGLDPANPSRALLVDGERGELVVTGTAGLVVHAVGASGNAVPRRAVGVPAGTVLPRALAADAARGELILASQGRVTVFDPAGKALRAFAVDGDVRAVALDDTRGELLVLRARAAGGAEVQAWPRLADGPAAAPLRTVVLEAVLDPVALLPWDGEWFVGDSLGAVRVFAADGAPLRTISGSNPGLAGVTALAADRGAGLLVVGSRSNSSLRFFDKAATGDVAPRLVATLTAGRTLGLVKDERTGELFSLDDLGTVTSLEVRAGKLVPLHVLKGPKTEIELGVGLALCK